MQSIVSQNIFVYIDFQNLSKSVSSDLFSYYIQLPGKRWKSKRIANTEKKAKLIQSEWYRENDFILVHIGWQLDYELFIAYLRDRFGAKKVVVCIWYIESNVRFYNKLESYGYELVFKKTLIQWETIKWNVDAELVMHASLSINTYDKAILVTGDGDFFCLAEELERRWKLERILTPNNHTFSQLYKPLIHRILPLTRIRQKLEYKKTSIDP